MSTIWTLYSSIPPAQELVDISSARGYSRGQPPHRLLLVNSSSLLYIILGADKILGFPAMRYAIIES
jgi:hypothetical protein